jgi:hypothetical protein
MRTIALPSNKIKQKDGNQSRRDGTSRSPARKCWDSYTQEVESRRDGIEPLRMKSWGL